LSGFNGNLISLQIFEKYTNIKFNENPSCGSRSVPRGQTDGRRRHNEANISFSKFCQRAYKCRSVWSLCLTHLKLPTTWRERRRARFSVLYFRYSEKKLQVLKYNRISKVLLITIMVVYNPNVKLLLEKRDL